jgi:hypothetical protein
MKAPKVRIGMAWVKGWRLSGGIDNVALLSIFGGAPQIETVRWKRSFDWDQPGMFLRGSEAHPEGAEELEPTGVLGGEDFYDAYSAEVSVMVDFGYDESTKQITATIEIRELMSGGIGIPERTSVFTRVHGLGRPKRTFNNLSIDREKFRKMSKRELSALLQAASSGSDVTYQEIYVAIWRAAAEEQHRRESLDQQRR